MTKTRSGANVKWTVDSTPSTNSKHDRSWDGTAEAQCRRRRAVGWDCQHPSVARMHRWIQGSSVSADTKLERTKEHHSGTCVQTHDRRRAAGAVSDGQPQTNATEHVRRLWKSNTAPVWSAKASVRRHHGGHQRVDTVSHHGRRWARMRYWIVNVDPEREYMKTLPRLHARRGPARHGLDKQAANCGGHQRRSMLAETSEALTKKVDDGPARCTSNEDRCTMAAAHR
ncbi:hypothetical protein PHLGIDRAFT_355918 [Phlebiopsis gigantea 11061_1 CR5-6]|uniref:Uncharacterized protein n=1 Tax=Phlebiopsis gigantea (strain 11061_1 CR5-6) TaxID=745531 RepID=A0A0C3S1Q1_PHLG1|nr:hypothetical protein PHLGIDRAFT_355918 [Phlebiopsis gigantea 11061_1 CR5-6]